MSRLLTDKECLAIVGLRFNQLNEPYDIMGSDITDLLKAQRDLTYKETLKQEREGVVVWLTEHIEADDAHAHIISSLRMNYCLRFLPNKLEETKKEV